MCSSDLERERERERERETLGGISLQTDLAAVRGDGDRRGGVMRERGEGWVGRGVRA